MNAKVQLKEDTAEEEINNSLSDLEAAWSQVEEDDELPTGGGDEAEVAPKPEPASEPEQEELPLAAETPQKPKEVAPEEKPPASWKPEVREDWAKLPPSVKQEIMRRERDFAIGIQQSREAAQRGRAFDQLLAPFRPMFTANGQNEVQGVQGVLQAAATLQMGTSAQKVKMVADLIGQYGVDLVALDSYLAEGSMPAQVNDNEHINQLLEQRLAPINQMVQQFQQHQQNQVRQAAAKAGQTVQQFGSDPVNEFYNDVKMDMADILDMAANRGINMSLKEAYDRACMLNPSISQVIQARKAAQSMTGKKRAAVSITGGPGAPQPKEVGDTITSAIEAAWDAHARQ